MAKYTEHIATSLSEQPPPRTSSTYPPPCLHTNPCLPISLSYVHTHFLVVLKRRLYQVCVACRRSLNATLKSKLSEEGVAFAGGVNQHHTTKYLLTSALSVFGHFQHPLTLVLILSLFLLCATDETIYAPLLPCGRLCLSAFSSFKPHRDPCGGVPAAVFPP